MSNQNWNAPGPQGHPSPQPPGRQKANWKLPLLVGAPALAVIVGIGGCVALGQPQVPATPTTTSPASQSPTPTQPGSQTVDSPVPIMEELPATVGGWNYTAVSDTQGFFDRHSDASLVLATADFGSVDQQAEVITDDVFLADRAIVCGSGFDGIACYIATPNHGNINLVSTGDTPDMAELQVLATDLLSALS